MAPIVAIPFLAKAGAMAKGLLGLKGAAGVAHAAKAVGGHNAARAAIGGMRFAGPQLAAFASRALPKTAQEAAMVYGPDVLFGGITAAMTPGDLGDKLIAGGSTAIGGAGGGLVGRGLVSPNRPALQMMADIGGGFVGDSAAMGVADSLLRLKGGGTTPYEKLAIEQQEAIKQSALRDYLSGRGYPGDAALSINGLG